MNVKTIIPTVTIMSVLTGTSLGEPANLASVYRLDSERADSPFSGALTAGYATNYDYKGLVFDNKAGESNTPIVLDLKYKLNDTYTLFGSLGYTAIWDKKDFINENESSFKIGIAGQYIKGLTASLNYGFTHGGMMGELLKHDRGNAHSYFQAFGGGLHYDFAAVGAPGLFAEVNVDYVFQGNTGWWFEGKVGYKYDFNSRVSAVLTGTAELTSGYYGHTSQLGDGVQALGLKLEFPCKVSRHISVVPFAGTWWLGSGANNINKTASQDYRLRNFTLAAGVSVTCSF